MAYDKSRALAALAEFQRSTGLNDSRWEAASNVGGGTLRKFREMADRSMNSSTYAKLADGAGRLLGRPVAVGEFNGEGVLRVPFDPVTEVNAVPVSDAPLPPYRSEMPKDVPLYGTAVGGTGQGAFDFELNGEVGDYVRRPPRIAGRADVFALFVQGDSMEHWRRAGQLIYVERVKPPSTMDYVLVELKPLPPDNVRPALVKQLLGITPTKVRLRQHNPPKDFDIDRKAVLRIYRIMDWDELLGV